MFSTLWPILLFFAFPLPIGTDRRLRHIPWVTWTLIVVNTVVYAATAHDPTVFDRYGLIPSHPTFASLFTYQFIHVSFAHLFWNMFFLWLFGPHVEDALGRVTFIALYFGGGVAAGLLHMAISLLIVGQGVATAPLIGASGAISSVLAPFALRFHRANIRLLWLPGLILPGGWGRLELPALWGLGVWLLQNLGGGAIKSLFPGQGGGTAYWAHIGGFVFGLVAAQLTDLLQDGRLDYLLQDARASLGRGQELLSDAVQNYRTFLEHDPDNAAVRVELARALALRHDGTAVDREDAAIEIIAAVRLYARQGRSLEAAGACAEARMLGLPLALSPRERLRLGSAAEERGDPETAIWLLRALIRQMPDAPEDEMARLKLGQMLAHFDAAEARPVLSSFLDKYPDSAWAGRVRDLLRQTYV
jgi:membrane associated rhomboid family serine protease